MAEIDQSGGDKSGKQRSKKMSTKIDMTPMVDLGFLLITFFMLTTTLQKPAVMQLNMPDKNDKSETTPVKLSESLTIVPWEDDKVYTFQGLPSAPIDMKASDYSAKGLRQLLFQYKEKVGKNEKGENKFVAVIKPADKSSYKNVVDILDEMAVTDNQRYAIVEITPEDEAAVKKFIADGGDKK